MTQFTVEVVRLHGDERWQEWAGAWREHAERVGALDVGTAGWQLLEHFRRERIEGMQLDWGTLLFAVDKHELQSLLPPDRELRPPGDGEPGVRVAELPAKDRYGLLVVECP